MEHLQSCGRTASHSHLTIDVRYYLTVVAEGSSIRIYTGQYLYNLSNLLLDITDSTHQYGKVGLYTWANYNAKFSNIKLDVQKGVNSSQLSSYVIDEGTTSAPSRWSIQDGRILQSSNIHDSTPDRNHIDKKGTYVLAGNYWWENYTVDVTLNPGTDNDAIGVMFRYRGRNDYYRFSMDNERSYQRLVKCEEGTYTLLWQRDEGYKVNQPYRLRIVVDGSRLRGYIREGTASSLPLSSRRRKLFDIRDRSHKSGKIGFYCWAHQSAEFSEVSVWTMHYEGIISRYNFGAYHEAGFDPIDRLEMNDLRSSFINEVDSEVAVPARVLDRMHLPDDRTPSDPLEPIQRAPELPIPLSRRLEKLAPYLMLPGIENVPENVVSLLETNSVFVASLLVGANHEMARELLWRGLQTDLSSTVFRQFWDIRDGGYSQDDLENAKDIKPISTWLQSDQLSTVINSNTDLNRIVFLIRSELIRRFPGARFYMVKAVKTDIGKRKPTSEVTKLLFSGRLADDIAYFGFPLSKEELIGNDTNAGYYFVIEQRVSASRFGLDISSNEEDTLTDWSNLAWTHINDAVYVTEDSLNVDTSSIESPQWGKNSAHMAAILHQKPVRVFVHAQELLQPPQ